MEALTIYLNHQDAKMPTKAHQHDSGYDLYSIEEKWVVPGTPCVIDTGLSIQLPFGFEGQIRSRSGLAAKHGVWVLNSPGTIDYGYCGDVKVILAGLQYYLVHKGDRIAQLVIAPVSVTNRMEVLFCDDNRNISDRKTNGLGSSGT